MRLVRWGFQNHQDLTKSGEKSEKSVDETVLNAIFPHPSIISVWIFLTEKTKKNPVTFSKNEAKWLWGFIVFYTIREELL